jgi:hypothetical protein
VKSVFTKLMETESYGAVFLTLGLFYNVSRTSVQTFRGNGANLHSLCTILMFLGGDVAGVTHHSHDKCDKSAFARSRIPVRGLVHSILEETF